MNLLIAFSLMALCVAVHALGLTLILRRHKDRFAAASRRPFLATWLLIRLAGLVILLHLFEISLWACFYNWMGALPNASDAFYFSAVTYTTTGYGDVLLPDAWRLVGGVEALTGILMCGISTGLFFAVFSKIYGHSIDP